MDVGTQHFFPSYGWDNMTDGQVYADEVELALMAEDLGFDVVTNRCGYRGGDHAVERSNASR